MSFAAFGARRGADWSSTTPPDWIGIANRTRQGLTGHEMLDNVALVHMGGRVYDPALGGSFRSTRSSAISAMARR